MREADSTRVESEADSTRAESEADSTRMHGGQHVQVIMWGGQHPRARRIAHAQKARRVVRAQKCEADSTRAESESPSRKRGG